MKLKQIIITLLVSQLFVWFGLFLSELFNVFIFFPFLFGVSIPLANWNSVNFIKWRSTIVLGLTSTALFFGTTALAFWISNLNMVFVYATVGLSGVGFLWFNSTFISTIKTNLISGFTKFIFVALSLPIGRTVLDNLGYIGAHYIFIFSTFFTTLGLCVGILTTEQR